MVLASELRTVFRPTKEKAPDQLSIADQGLIFGRREWIRTTDPHHVKKGSGDA